MQSSRHLSCSRRPAERDMHRSSSCPLIIALLVMCLGSGNGAFAQGQRNQQPAAGPQLYSSRNFQVMTDLDAEEAQELLDRLETMLRLVSGYFGRPNTKPIDMFVVEDISRWPQSALEQMDENGLASIRGGGGLTITQVVTNGQQFDSKSVVFATSARGTPQHEAVHAYCGHAFGRTGPVWYGEGMAEVGNYWRENDKSVTAEPYVIQYLQSSEIRPLTDIVNNPLERTGDSWQNYAWRWALCHLLGFNENYTDRFKPLGLQLLRGNDIDFWEVYGNHAAEIDFEYRQFLTDIDAGYRCDLCSWDWRTRFRPLQSVGVGDGQNSGGSRLAGITRDRHRRDGVRDCDRRGMVDRHRGGTGHGRRQ